MALSISQSWGTLANPFNYAELVAFVQSSTINFTGTAGTTDIANGAVTAAKFTPGAYAYIAGAKSGSAPNEIYTVDLSPAPASLVAGLWLVFQADAANTGAVQVKVAASGGGYLATKYLKKFNGADLQTGDILAGTIVWCAYDGTNYVMISNPARPPRIVAGTAGGTANAITLTITPSTISLAELVGTEIEFTVGTTNTSAVTITFNALTTKALTKQYNVALLSADLTAGQVVRCCYDGTQVQMITPANSLGADNVITGGFRNLVAYNNIDFAHVEFTAAEFVVKNTAGQSHLCSTVSLSVQLSGSNTGLNKLDTGSVAASTWYYLWVIYNPTTNTTAGVMSTARTAPDLSAGAFSGYTMYALATSVRVSAGSLVSVFEQRDRQIWIDPQTVFASAAGPVTPTRDFVDCTAIIPPIAKTVTGVVGTTTAGVSALVRIYGARTAISGALVGSQDFTFAAATAAGLGGFRACGNFTIPVTTTGTQGFYWETSVSTNYQINLAGYTI